ncbi:hypothetical protein [Piscibacillus salipiscarius]|uniref:hypothetical protein n=1 Tax=Piscibacillus salipiscarius TaxID=299480 RepID=UPI0024369A54|nr:hypothetical protein [Piscibacillus salipiscarius]
MKYKNSLLILLGLTMLLLPACNNEAANAESDKQDETEVNVEDQNKSNSTNVQTSGEQR